MTHRDERPNIILVSLVAGLVGAGLALLLAPRSGRETRAKLQTSANGLKHRAQENYEHLRDQAKDTLQHATNMKDKVASAIKTRKEQAEDNLEDITEEAPPRRRSSVVTNWDEEV